MTQAAATATLPQENELILGYDGTGAPIGINLKYANRHGLIAGATGTGKTITLQRMAEQFSSAGIPVFITDIKGEFSGLCQPGSMIPPVAKRLESLKLTNHPFRGFPTIFWDVFGKEGHPLRTTMTELGPLLLAKLLNLSEAQFNTLYSIFGLSDKEGLGLIDLKDMEAMTAYILENFKEIGPQASIPAKATVAAIQRQLMPLKHEGGEAFFGEPSLNVMELLRTSPTGEGYIHILDATALANKPAMYATTLLWLLSELFENLPEAGDQPKPKMALFFDEAHLLFRDTPPALIQKIEQVVRIIRSKGVGVYFVTQIPDDVPDPILAQLGNRVQHALRAFTPKDAESVKKTAATFRPNPAINIMERLTGVPVGVALVSTLGKDGAPQPVQEVSILPPLSMVGPVAPGVKQALRQQSPYFANYEIANDRESAYERLAARVKQQAEEAPVKTATRASTAASPMEKIATSAARSLASQVARSIGRELVRGLLGSLSGKRR
jgi:DNA helicase HerA-like ATPase